MCFFFLLPVSETKLPKQSISRLLLLWAYVDVCPTNEVWSQLLSSINSSFCNCHLCHLYCCQNNSRQLRSWGVKCRGCNTQSNVLLGRCRNSIDVGRACLDVFKPAPGLSHLDPFSFCKNVKRFPLSLSSHCITLLSFTSCVSSLF